MAQMTCKKVRKKAPERHFTNLEQTISLSKKILDLLMSLDCQETVIACGHKRGSSGLGQYPKVYFC